MESEQFDLVVLGGGNAITVAIEAARAGQRVAVVEEGPLGGTCPNRGCIPTKLLIGYAERAQAVREAGRFHVDAHLEAIDGPALLRETFDATRQTDGKIASALPDSATLVRARGRFVGERTIEADGRRLQGTRVVVATGGRPRRTAPGAVPGLDDTPYWTSRDVFDLEDLPTSIVVVGGGYIGCELAHFFHGVGVETTLVHRSERLLPAEDEDVRAVFQTGFVARVPTLLDTNVVDVAYDGRTFDVTIEGPTARRTLRSAALLYAIGRVPNADAIGADIAGIATDARGFITVDDHLRTSAAGVYAMGDVTGGYQFTHSAAREATYLADALVRNAEGPLDLGPVPHAVFSEPEVAGVGATEADLAAGGVAFRAASVPYIAAAKGRAIKEAHGLCKFLVAPGTGEILGCHIVGRDASILLHEVIPVMRWRNRIDSLTDIIHIHPSLSEVVRNAARKAAALVDAPA